jgi:hypothetical protein
MARTIRAAVLLKPRTLELREFARPTIGADDALLRIEACGIGSIEDCEATLARNPHHFGALSGQGLCHMARGESRAAAALFRRALVVHPHLHAARQNLRVALAEAIQGNGH